MPAFVPRQRKKGAQRRGKREALLDTNQIQIIPEDKTEKEARRQNLRDELRASQTSISRKKQKRLDKYIDNKSRKEENQKLLEKLSRSKFDTSQLQSSRTLGKRKHDTFLSDIHTASARAMSTSEFFDESSAEETGPARPAAHTVNDFGSARPGKGLQRPLMIGEDGFPVIAQRERRRKPPQLEFEMPWEGFDSTASSEDEGRSSIDPLVDASDGDVSGVDSIEDSSEDTEEEDSADDLSQNSSEPRAERPKLRNSAFKTWATQQINKAADFTPTTFAQSGNIMAARETSKPTEVVQTAKKGKDQDDHHEVGERVVFSVPIKRSPAIEIARSELPVVAEEQAIMEAIHNNPIVIVSGDTGSGKTTQIPQFLFEAGYGTKESPTPGMIGITQPRRVAAVSMSQRVADELGDTSSKVGYQIRFDANVSSKTAIKFMTDGILLREISQDFALTKYSAIVVDEAHERSVNTDILIGMLSRIVPLRKKMAIEDPEITPLKLIIMSATLQMNDFLQNPRLFPNDAPPVVTAEGRQFPVTVHFARRTQRDYLEEIFRKVSKGHRKLPPGGFLVFLTGQNEIKALQNRLENALKPVSRSANFKTHLSAAEFPIETEDLITEESIPYEGDEEDTSDVEFLGYDEDDDADFDIGEATSATPLVNILPLFSQLPTKEQLRVFEPSPSNTRMIVLATNVAETSLTIPGIRYVFDSGRSKQRKYEDSTGILRYQTDWISKSSASQRSGRAGRTGPGHCYRLYSSAVYERDFVEHTVPEILSTPVESVVLQLKSMGIDRVLGFPFPTIPSNESLVKAEKLLKNLGALMPSGQVTSLGHALPTYPVSPRLGKILVNCIKIPDCLPFVIAMVAALAVGEMFIAENQIHSDKQTRDADDVSQSEDGNGEDREQVGKSFAKAQAELSSQDKRSDAIKMFTALCAYSYETDGDRFCKEKFLRPKALKEASQLQTQLAKIVQSNLPSQLLNTSNRLPVPSSRQLNVLKELVAAGFIDQIAIRADLAPVPPELPAKPKRAIDVPYLPLIPLASTNASLYEKTFFIHPSSLLARMSPKNLPQYVVYSHLHQSTAGLLGASKIPKIRMFPLTDISGNKLTSLASGSPLLSYGKPIGKIEEAGGAPARRECWVVPSLAGHVGTMGWPLPARKVLQRKDPKEGWVIEKFLTMDV
ncbi:MAG: hypothetical protein Q9227_009368 [Pyrenula ochraceoflavens]